MREWIIFAICLGLGGHIALGFVLHQPESSSLQDAGVKGLLGGLGIYLLIQIGRSVWWRYKTKLKST